MENTSKEVNFQQSCKLLAHAQNVPEADSGPRWTSGIELLEKTVKSIQPLKSSIIVIWQGPKSTFLYFLIKNTWNSNYWSILDVIKNRTFPSGFTCLKSTIETLEHGVKYAQS